VDALTRCIYCRAATGHFSAEHVIPQQFGKFQGNLTLHCVCDECNQYFGRTLEWELGRNTAEGILRIDYGLRSAKIGDVPSKGIDITVRSPGPYVGAKVLIQPSEKMDGTEAQLLAQVGVKVPGSDEHVWYSEPEVNDQFAGRYRRKGSQFILTGPTEGDRQRLRQKLLKLGIKVNAGELRVMPLAGGGKRLGISISYNFDDRIPRCIAKIAFNYLAHLQGQNFVLAQDFDRIREYIRYPGSSDTNKSEIVFIMNKRILSIPDGHSLAAAWSATGDKVVVNVSMFNTVEYTVFLCQRYRGIWREIAKGHHFSLKTGRISEISVCGEYES